MKYRDMYNIINNNIQNYWDLLSYVDHWVWIYTDQYHKIRGNHLRRVRKNAQSKPTVVHEKPGVLRSQIIIYVRVRQLLSS